MDDLKKYTYLKQTIAMMVKFIDEYHHTPPRKRSETVHNDDSGGAAAGAGE